MGWMIQGLISGKGKTFPLLRSVKTGHWAYPVSYSMDQNALSVEGQGDKKGERDVAITWPLISVQSKG
jgi:hypothetical protein